MDIEAEQRHCPERQNRQISSAALEAVGALCGAGCRRIIDDVTHLVGVHPIGSCQRILVCEHVELRWEGQGARVVVVQHGVHLGGPAAVVVLGVDRGLGEDHDLPLTQLVLLTSTFVKAVENHIGLPYVHVYTKI